MSIDDFVRELRNYGFALNGPAIADGKWHPHDIVSDKRGSKNGRYILNEQDGRLWGTYGDWKTGTWINWKGVSDGRSSSPTLAAARTTRTVSATTDFLRMWNSAAPADPAHPYLIRKAVLPFGIRHSKGQLLIPVRRIDGTLVGLQRISANGKKRFYKGTKKQSAFHQIGEGRGTLLIAEGYATAASCYMATGICSIVAFDAGNLEHVGRVIRSAFPYARLVFAADDDDRGRQEALRASEIVRGSVLNPNDITTKGIT